MEYNKDHLAILLIAFLFALVAYSTGQSALDNNAFEVVVNNTDKGILGTGERLHNVLYYANDSAIQILLIFHVVGNGASQTVDSNLSINGTVVLDRDFKTSAGAGIHDHFSYSTIIPKYASYQVTNSSNVYQLEWREYPILTGRNGTLSINQTIVQGGGSGGVSFNGTPVNLNGSLLFNGSINKTSTDIDMMNHKITNSSGVNSSSTYIYNPDNINMATNTNWVASTDSLYAVKTDANTIMTSQVNSNNTAQTSFFGAYKAGWNSTTQTKYALQSGDVFFNFFGKGWDGTTWGLSAANIELKTAGAWNSTSHPTQINFYTQGVSGSKQIRLTIQENGNITVSGLTGSGNDYVCVDTNGNLFRSNSGC